MKYDLIVIGGGPGGYLAAERAAQGGLKTLLIEERALGGVCLNEGCIPSKAFLNSAKIYEHACDGAPYGVTVTGAAIDQRAVVARKNRVVKSLVAGVLASVKASGAKVLQARGELLGRTGEGLFAVSAGGENYTAEKLIIATGSAPAVPPIPGLKEGLASGFVMTNREILALEEIPKRLVVIGGGVIGLEMASYFNSAGSSVTVIEMLDHIAGPTDREVSDMLKAIYEKKGVVFKLLSRVSGISSDGVSYESGGSAYTAPADRVLLSIGRRPVTEGFGLEKLGVYTERGAIKTDRTGQTNVPGVYAVGDVNGVSMLAHTAYREAEVAVNSILGKKDIMRYEAIPSVIYTTPEAAGVGLTEESARAAGIDYEVGRVPMAYSGRFLAENDGASGFCKVLAEKAGGRIIGAHILGPYASEFVLSAAMMIECELRIRDASELVFPHPTVCEALRDAIFALKKGSR